MERRWLLRLVPPAVAAVTVATAAATSIGATDAGWDPAACAGGLDRVGAAARAGAPGSPGALAGEPWYALDPRIDETGELAGQRLRVGVGVAPERTFDLPPESVAAGPFGRLVLVADDDGRRSEIRALDPGAGCGWLLGTAADVVRRAILDPAGSAVYEFRVERESRADAGIWRRPLVGAAATRVLPPIEPDRSVGVTFTTSLFWSAESDRLVVQSCGAVRCRVRTLDPASGAVQLLAGADQGETIGVAGGRAIGYAACVGLPCPIVSTALASGESIVVEPAGGLARMIDTALGPRIAVESHGTIRVVAADGSDARTIPVSPAGLRLVPGGDRPAAGWRLPRGWIALSPDGRRRDGAVLVRLVDGNTVGLEGAIR